VLDGFGIGDGGGADATALANTPFFDSARSKYPSAQLDASGESVGLPPGQMGNSEVGHMTMGAGRVIEQDVTRITRALAEGELETNAPIQSAIAAVEAGGGTLHLMGLLSDGGVHSQLGHLTTMLAYLGNRGVRHAVHAFLDGRDTPPSSGHQYIRQVVSALEHSGGHVATLMGRYFAMDRDNRWSRIGRAYHAMVCREGLAAPDPITAVEQAYARGETDEFIQPTVIVGGATLADGDAVIFFNYRSDRARQLTNALTGALPRQFEDSLKRKRVVKLATFVCFTEYDVNFDLPVAFPSGTPAKILGEIVADAGVSQLRIAETEKYAHVTYFFNGGVEAPFPDEDRALISSPRDVPSYDHKPAMSAIQLTDEALAHIASGKYGFILINYANPDMVGHTGDLDATVKAVETVDRSLSRIAEAVLQQDGTLLVTADHGNCEQMVDPKTHEVHTAHTTNYVPIFWIAHDAVGRQLRDGGLVDLAPTVLDLMKIPQPEEMSGRTLIARND
jgi:2,3-bisphosphoglycerate-independent phosphoglycerate mutase